MCKGLNISNRAGIPVFRDCEGAPEMVVLRGGHYKMGDPVGDGQPYERPAHEVDVPAFALDRFEVTNGEWGQCVAAGACSASKVVSDSAHDRYPVAGVSWTQVNLYTGWLSQRTGKQYRLPSEAEWEYAARAGSSSRYTWGTFDPKACNYANLLDVSGRREHPEWTWSEACDDRYGGTAPVGSFPPNAWGFYDMLGNVWEWVLDCWHADYAGAPGDGAAWLGESCRKHVNRGGGWGNNARALRLSSRDADSAESFSDGLGFRVARTLGPAEFQSGLEAAPDGKAQEIAAPRVTSEGKRQGDVAAASQSFRAVSAPIAPVTSLVVERALEVNLSVKGSQAWRSGLQHTDGSTDQVFTISTHLKSDGVLYGDNLLDPDQATRLGVKHQYLARRGLIMLKQLGGGRLPQSAEELKALEAKAQDEIPECRRDVDCSEELVERVAALEALQTNSVQDLEALIESPASGDSARWMYFFGYAGCPGRLRIRNQTHVSGLRAYDHDRKHLVPWSLDRTADTDGSSDQAAICRHYTATVDTRTGDVYVENLYLPSPLGTTIRSRNGQVEKIREELPVPSELMAWVNRHLARTRETLEVSESLQAHAPFDQDYTILGQWSGNLDVSMKWAFLPVSGASQATLPASGP